MECGGQCVMTSGTIMMPLWFADNLASQLKVSDHNCMVNFIINGKYI